MERKGSGTAALLTLSIAIGFAIALLVSGITRTSVPCGPYSGCELALQSGALKIAGWPAWFWIVPAAPVLLLIGRLGSSRAFLVSSGVLLGVLLTAEFWMWRLGWFCPPCHAATIGLIAGMTMHRGIAGRISSVSVGMSLVLLAMPLTVFRWPLARTTRLNPEPLLAKTPAVIPRARLTGLANDAQGVTILIGNPYLPGMRARAIKWAASGKQRGWRLVHRPIASSDPRGVVAAIGVRIALAQDDARWKRFFDERMKYADIVALNAELGLRGVAEWKARRELAHVATDMKLCGFRSGDVLDCLPNDVCRWPSGLAR